MIKVLKSGFYSTIQDLGRVGYQQFGVPISGAMDSYSAELANVILGNDINDAVLEITLSGPKLKFACNTFICISGANMSPTLNSQPIHLNKRLSVKPDDVLLFGKLNYGVRCYLGVSGGFKTECVMNSRSMYQNITNQSVILKDDMLSIENAVINSEINASVKINQNDFSSPTIEVFEGPEFSNLPKAQQNQLFSKVFAISKNNNRMAYQLEETLENDLKPIITSSVLPGTVQLTPSGKLIVLMQDCQTTGGYPRVLQLKESAINTLAQKFTGSLISFKLK